jgi:guanine deaminase
MATIEQKWLDYVLILAMDNVKHGGGPFAALILRDGELIAEGVNSVTSTNDPTAHAEVTAIRKACEKLGRFQLDDCILIASCEPCPMCFGAIYWARLSEVMYLASGDDAAGAGFDDKFIRSELKLPLSHTRIPFRHIVHSDAGKPFEYWKASGSKTEY